MSKDCWGKKYCNNDKKIEKGEKAIVGDEDDMVLCLFTMESKKENVKEKVWFVGDVKQPSEAGMMCTVDGNMFFSFTKNNQIGDSDVSCHITNDNTGMNDDTNINETIQGSSRIMPATKKGKLCVNVQQVDETDRVLSQGRCITVFPKV